MDNTKETTFDLIARYYDITDRLFLLNAAKDDEINMTTQGYANLQKTKAAIEKEQKSLETALTEKVDSLHWVVFHMKEHREEIEATKRLHANAVKALNKRLTSIDNTEHRLQDLIKDVVKTCGDTTENNGYRLRTDTETYSVFNADGKLIIKDSERIPEAYLRYEEKLDAQKLRRDIIAKGETDYAVVEKQERLVIR